MKNCHICGAEVSDTAKFCRKCGARIDAGKAPESADAKAGEAADQPAEQMPQEPPLEQETPEPVYEGQDYSWGPPTGGEDYDEPAMPAVFLRDADAQAGEDQSRQEQAQPYSYRLEAPDWDHTDEFDPKDISDNKVTAMAAYLLGALGVIIALLAGQNSPYAAFHMRQGLKFVVVDALLSIVAVLLCWTFVVPIAAGIFWIVLMVVKIITFFSVCRGKAVEPAIIRSMGFLK